jgi:hypothetical protein
MSRGGPEGALMLLSAGTAIRREASREHAQALSRLVDWERLTLSLAARRLLPQLGERIVELSAGHAPNRFAAAVEQAVAKTRRQGALLELVAMRLTRAFAVAGIDSMMLKGAFLGEAIYGDPGRRAAGDIDLLVGPNDLSAAVEIARRTGYGAPSDHVGSDGLPLLHYALAHESGQLPPLELHWRVHWYERAFSRDMLARAVEDPRWGLRAGPVDELASLLLFYARDGFLDLRLATDLGAWWDAFGSQLQQGSLAAILERYPDLKSVLLASAVAAERVVGVPADRLIGRSQRLSRRDRLAASLAEPNPKANQAQRSADAGLVDWLLTPPGGQSEFRQRQLLLPGGALTAGHPRESERRLFLTAEHLTRVLGRFGLRIARLLRDSCFSPFALRRDQELSPIGADPWSTHLQARPASRRPSAVEPSHDIHMR